MVTTTAPPAKTVTTTVPESDVQPLVLVAFGDSVISYPEPSEVAIEPDPDIFVVAAKNLGLQPHEIHAP